APEAHPAPDPSDAGEPPLPAPRTDHHGGATSGPYCPHPHTASLQSQTHFSTVQLVNGTTHFHAQGAIFTDATGNSLSALLTAVNRHRLVAAEITAFKGFHERGKSAEGKLIQHGDQ